MITVPATMTPVYAIVWCESTSTGIVWHDTPITGLEENTVAYRDLQTVPTLEYHTPTAYLLPVGSGDYSGSPTDRANREWLSSHYPAGTFVTVEGGHGFLTLLIPADSPELSDVCEAITGLDNYPLINDDTYTELEHTLIMDALTDRAMADIIAAAARILPGFDTDRVTPADIIDAYRFASLDRQVAWVEGMGDSNVHVEIDPIAQALLAILPSF